MEPEMQALVGQAEGARAMYRAGLISRESCEEKIKPYAEAYNKRAKELAKEFKVKFKPFSITGYLR